MNDKLIVSLQVKDNIYKVGTLATKNNKIYFEYNQTFLNSNIQLSPYKLPLKAGVQLCKDDTFDGLWGVFADSLPDGWGRLLVDRRLANLGINPNSITALDRLSYVGRFGMGALSYEPVHEDGEDLSLAIVLDDLARSSYDILEGSSDEMLGELLALGGSSAGARPKVLVQLSDDYNRIVHGRQVLQDGFTHFLVKFASSLDGKEIGVIEYAYSLMAKDAGLDMPQTTLLDGRKGRYFACERFDRVRDDRVHMHSVAGLTHSDFRFPMLDYDDLLALTMHLCKNVQEVKKMFRLACFNLFAHNRDDHAKNFSFLMDEKGHWRLSPAYDLTFSYGPGGEHSTTYLGEGKNPTKEHLKKLGEKHLLKESECIIAEVYESVQNWKKFAKEAELSIHQTQKIASVLKI